VNRILADHDATIRVEDNMPAGARFVVDLPVRTGSEAEAKAAEMPAAEIRS
jgi:K+-sensing histidine kinase KdpD